VRLALAAGAIVVVAGVGVGVGVAVSGGNGGGGTGVVGTGVVGNAADYLPLSTLGTLTAAPAAGALGPENVPIPSAPALAGASAATAGQTIDGIGCETSEQTVFHIHTHLTIFVNGEQRQVPPAIGIPGAVAQQTSAGPFIGSGTCFYWLHTHAADGIIHIESPVERTYTLGEFSARRAARLPREPPARRRHPAGRAGDDQLVQHGPVTPARVWGRDGRKACEA
jgi:hypothetical protein